MSQASHASHSAKPAAKKGLWARIVQFFHEVLIELKKVQRPTRSELWKMFLTVIFFVAVIMAFVGILDVVFNQAVFWIFG